jgi:hypothetical protein
MTVECLGVVGEQGHYRHCNHYLSSQPINRPQVLIDRTPEGNYCLHLLSLSSLVPSFTTFILLPHVRDHVALAIWSQHLAPTVF